jgi:c-di-GMP phosphodiesterase
MKEQGYRLALDDYCDQPETQPLLAIADFVKIDVLLTSIAEQERIVNVLNKKKIPVIAEKVETDE